MRGLNSITMYRPLDCLKAVKTILCGLPNYESQSRWLCESILELDSARMLLNDAVVTDEKRQELLDKADRLKNGYPLQYLLGQTQFMGLDFIVRENVLIPRNDTEPMTEMAIKHIGNKDMRVLDLCCGSGCIGLSIAYYCKNAKVVLGDISDGALALTKDNATALGVDVDIKKTDMFNNLDGAFDLIISNPPYIPSKVIPTLSVQVQHEPLLALDGTEDGLKFYRIIKEDYRRFLKNNGIMLLEIGYDQGDDMLNIFGDGQIFKDLQGRNRIFKLERKDV